MMTTPEQRLAAAKRELALRKEMYPRWVKNGHMRKAMAEHELAAMADIVEVLRGLATEEEEPHA